MPYNPLAEMVRALIMIPIEAVSLVLRIISRFAAWVIRRRGLPPYQRNLTRATWAAFVLAATLYAATVIPNMYLHGNAGLVLAGVGLVAVIYLGIGVFGSGGAPFDPVSLIWWAALSAGAGFLLIERFYTVDALAKEVIEGLYIALLTAGLVRVALGLRPLPSAKLPDPATVPDMPMAGPASMRDAHAAMSRRGGRPRPKFRT